MKRTVNASLRNFNSFSVEARAARLLELETPADWRALHDELAFDERSDLVLGGGSNVLLVDDIDGTVILNRVKGRKIVNETEDGVLLEACAGENWHELVLWCLQQGLSGIENLALIPGLAGAAPIQNIGAYGVELSEVTHSVQALELDSGQFREFSRAECGFAYRDSRFRAGDGARYLVTRIRLLLQRSFEPRLEYAGIAEELRAMGIRTPDARQVAEAVIRIRRRKLPDPGVAGNAGSFFKNPLVGHDQAESLKLEFAGLPVHASGPDRAKISAAWMIEKCGWKGHRMGGAAVSDKHALVLVNRGNATGRELLALAASIAASVRERFGVELQPEPHIVQNQKRNHGELND